MPSKRPIPPPVAPPGGAGSAPPPAAHKFTKADTAKRGMKPRDFAGRKHKGPGSY